MGLAASQARLLSITQRISDNELRAQLINNQKMRLNSESSKVSENYINALNKTNLVFANYDSEDKAQNVPLTFKNLTAFNQYNNQYNLTNTAGNVLISEDDAEKYKASGGNLEDFLEEYGITYTTSYWDTIANQLKDCEAYYSNPDLDGIAEATTTHDFTYTNAAGETVRGDGKYSFFTADELKAMYEGTNTGIKYEAMAKHPDYINFTKYFDKFTLEMVKYDNAVADQTLARTKAFGNILKDSSCPKITTSDVTLDSTSLDFKVNKTFNFGPVLDLSSFSAGGEITSSNLKVDDYTKDLTLSNFGVARYDNVSSKYYGETEWNIVYKQGLTNLTSSGTSPDKNSLYYSHTYTDSSGHSITDTYIQMMSPTTDTSGNVTTYWLKLNATGTTTAYITATGSNVYKSSNGGALVMATTTDTSILSGDTTDKDGNKNGTYSNSISFNKSTNTYSATYTTNPDSGTPTTASQNLLFPAPNATQLTKPQIVYTENELKESIVKYVNSTVVTKMLEDLTAHGAKIKSTHMASLTPEQQAIVNTPVSSDMPEIVKSLSELLVAGTKHTTTAADGTQTTKDGENPIIDGKEMQALLEAIMTGTKPGLVRNSDGTYTATYSYKDSTTKQNINATATLKETAKALIDALVCDTMMDYFGEPVYGYMKENASGELVTADEEARWYTNLFNKIKSCGFQVLADGLANSTDWMQFALENGIVVMEQINSEQNWQPITHTSCSDVIEQTDTQAATLAEAEYNKAMRQIEAKDEMFDLELKNIDTEHASLESEYESVKKAMTGNIERTFQMYG